MLDTLYFNFICIALTGSLKGLERPYIYDNPLNLALQRAKTQARNLEEERRVGDPAFQG